MSRLRKAVGHTDTLTGLCNSDKCDARTKLEVKVKLLIAKASSEILFSKNE